MREYGDNGHQKSTSRNSFYATSEKEHEWVPFDSIDISLMGKSFHRMKERVFLAEYRYKVLRYHKTGRFWVFIVKITIFLVIGR